MTDELTINYSNADIQNHMSYQSPQQKTVPKSNPPQTYNEVPVQYNFGDDEKPKIAEFLLEFPEVYSNGGLIEKPGQNGKIELSIMISLPQDNPDTKMLVDKLQEVWLGCCSILNQFKGGIGLGRVNFANPEAAVAAFKQPVYFPADKVTGEPIPGRNPSMFLKCFRRGFGALQEKTLFVKPTKVVDDAGKPVLDDNGEEEVSYEPIDWELLKGVEMKFIPLVHIKKIYVGGGKASLQMEVVSAIVTYISGRGTTIKNTATIKNLIKANPDLPNTLEEQIAKLTSARQGMMETKVDHGQGKAETRQTKEDVLMGGTNQPINNMNTMQNFLGGGGGGSNGGDQSPPKEKPTPTLRMPTIKLA